MSQLRLLYLLIYVFKFKYLHFDILFICKSVFIDVQNQIQTKPNCIPLKF